jgi:hypothetical protein
MSKKIEILAAFETKIANDLIRLKTKLSIYDELMLY